ncbi:hypothetical protein [Streptomyces longwoodensis]
MFTRALQQMQGWAAAGLARLLAVSLRLRHSGWAPDGSGGGMLP